MATERYRELDQLERRFECSSKPITGEVTMSRVSCGQPHSLVPVLLAPSMSSECGCIVGGEMGLCLASEEWYIIIMYNGTYNMIPCVRDKEFTNTDFNSKIESVTFVI